MPSEREELVAAATDRVEEALGAGMRDLDGSMVIKWVVTFEYLNQDGERGIATLASPGLMKWDVEGMLRHVLKNDDLDSLRQMLQPDEGES